MKRIARVAAALLLLTGCGNGEPPERADYMLQWYPRASSDYGELVPGFKSLAMCRRAGSGKTIASYGGLVAILTPEGSQVRLPREDGPWFECMSNCRPHMDGSYLLVCKHIVEVRGIETLSPR
jgi:hypothetical protein